MDHDHGEMIWRNDAIETVLNIRQAILADQPVETIRLDGLAGRILSTNLVAEHDSPAHDRATMDGYAFDATDNYPLSLIDAAVYPEDDPPSIDTGEAVEIATGARLPEEANATLKREEADVHDRHLRGSDIEPGTYTYERGSNVTAGEELFKRGERLTAKDAILLGDLGYDELEIFERFSVGILATGTEIHEGRQQDLDSNMLAGLVRSWGHEATYEGTVPDEYEQVETAIEKLAKQYDAVLTTGGTSVGHKDYVIRALEELGDVHFHRVRIRPGKPIAVATLTDADAIAFAIPGKPIGAYTISTLVVRPFFTGRTDLPTVNARLISDVDLGSKDFEYVIPVTLENEIAIPLGRTGSTFEVYERQFDPSVLSSSTRASRADGFIITETPLSANETVSVTPYPIVE